MARMRKVPTGKDLLKKAAAGGYRHGAHRHRDIIKDIPRYVTKTLRDQDWALNRYISIEEGGGEESKAERDDEIAEMSSISTASCLRKELPCPDLATAKDFLCFHIALSRGRIKGKITVGSVNTFAEWFFAGFTRVTGTVISEDYRSTIYEWVRSILTKEGLIVNVKKPKYLFDIEVVLLRVPNGWKVIYQINQRWVKNNRDPENITYFLLKKLSSSTSHLTLTRYGASTSEHEKLIFDDTQYLLALAFPDKAFYEINSFKEFWKLKIKEGETTFHLRWKDSVMNLPILRSATLNGGVSNDPLPRTTFEGMIRSVMEMSGYFGCPIIHAIRRGLGKKLNERYNETERSQYITQNDPRIYGQSYVANTSSCDGRRAFLNEAAEHDHIEYFQGFGKFRENGLPRYLPAEKKKPSWKRMKDSSNIRRGEASGEIRNYYNSLYRASLREYQTWWIQDRRDWKIRTGGRGQADDSNPTELVRALSAIIPERGRLAGMMVSGEVVSEWDRKQTIRDLYSFIARDYTVLYRPGKEPVNGTCPVKDCGTEMERQKELEKAYTHPPSDFAYCFQCFAWFVKEEWDIHFTRHLNPVSSKRCGSITYCHTLIRPAYCPFCLGNETLSAEKRLQAWTRDSDLMVHLEKHISQVHWPSSCPHPLCDAELNDETSSWYHLNDAHNLRKASKKGQKRRWEAVASGNDDGLQTGTSHGVEKKPKATRPKDKAEIEVVKYSPLHSFKPSPASINGDSLYEKQSRSPRRQLATSMDPTISRPLTLLSSTSLTTRDYDHDTECSTVLDLNYTGNSPSDGPTLCPTESPPDFWMEPLVNSKESTDITVVDLTDDKSSEYDDLLFKYTTILSSSGKEASNDDSNKGLPDLASDKYFLPPETEISTTDTIDHSQAIPNKIVQIKSRKSGIKLRLNPPKRPSKILLRVKQPEQVSPQKRHGRVEKNDGTQASRIKKSGRKRYIQN
ncbi:MAG: hypothetical protein M1840_005743 [Geoglossum simile]|nr:MAG: hypothetical protein M1840_005743 [Geoglossum simile]